MIGTKQKPTPALRRGVNAGFVDLDTGFLGRMTPAAAVAAARGETANFFAAITPGGIEAQEKRGQLEQAEKQELPVEGTSSSEHRKMFEALGFKFGKRASLQDLFVACEFPKGWKKVPTEHSMWSDLVDDKGRKRGGIFFKAAFYDTKAHVSLSKRFSVDQTYPAKSESMEVFVKDARGDVEFRLTGLKTPDWNKREEALVADTGIREAHKACELWLDQHWPEWRSETAYW